LRRARRPRADGPLRPRRQERVRRWFASLLAVGLLGFGVVAMIAYVVAGPDGTKQRVARPGIAEAART